MTYFAGDATNHRVSCQAWPPAGTLCPGPMCILDADVIASGRAGTPVTPLEARR